MSIPASYEKTYLGVIRFSLVMMFLALINGILFQESSKKLPDTLAEQLQFTANYHLSLIHGHTFLIGVLIPMAVLAMMYFAIQLKAPEISEKARKWGFRLYCAGAVAAVLLMLYKGYHIQLGVRHQLALPNPQIDFKTIEQSLFAGMVPLRHAIYALSHTSLAAGLCVLVFSIWKSLGKRG